MPWAAAATVVAAGISAATAPSASGSIAGGQAQANEIAKQTIAEGRTNYQQDRSTYQPFVTQGTNALTQYGDVLGINGADAASKAMASFTASPGYAYSVEQGLKGVDAGAAAKGMLRSGATLKAEQTLGTNLANQQFGDYVSRLNALSGFGIQGAQGQAASTSTFNNLLTGQANNQQSTDTSAAASQAGITDAFGNKLTSAANYLGTNGSSIYNKLSGIGTTGTNTSSVNSGGLLASSSGFGGVKGDGSL